MNKEILHMKKKKIDKGNSASGLVWTLPFVSVYFFFIVVKLDNKKGRKNKQTEIQDIILLL